MFPLPPAAVANMIVDAAMATLSSTYRQSKAAEQSGRDRRGRASQKVDVQPTIHIHVCSFVEHPQH